MDICKMDLMYGLDKYERCLKSTKYDLARIDVLSESIKWTRNEELAESKSCFAVSSLCTKLMQLNAGLERLNDIIVHSVDDPLQNLTNVTANNFTMFSILDELQLNDSEKPAYSSDGVPVKPGYTGVGFISHIEHELTGKVYILDVKSMPDSVVLFGAQPKRLTELPKPGEMFGYVFREKYLVRAVRLQYESYAIVNQTKQYHALLIDIGCVVRIDINPTLHNHFEVSSAAKAIPPYAKLCQLIEIPSKMSLGDLLHTRIQYRVESVNFRDGDMALVNILNKGANPFAADQQKEWHFYMYFIGNHNNGLFQSNKKNPFNQSAVKRADVRSYDPNLNPFADPSLYNIESIPSNPLIDKTNPFYFDLVDEQLAKPKFTNFRLTKTFNAPNGLGDIDGQLVPESASKRKRSSDEEKILNSIPIHKQVTEIESNLRQNYEKIEKHKSVNGFKESMSYNDSTNYQTKEINIPVVTPTQPMTIPKSVTPPNPVAPPIPIAPTNPIVPKTTPPIKQPTPATSSEMSNPVKAPTQIKSDFATPKYLPKVGEKIKVLYQTMLSVEQFYAVIVDDPTRSMPVQDFSLMINQKQHTRKMVQYDENCTPKLNDKVFALYEHSFYRAKVINVIDSHVFKVFYVDYGNCEKVNTRQVFKYDGKWDEYPPYVLHFRINGIKETNPWDFSARGALEQIMITDCDATIVGIERCEKTHRTTYIVDLHDENGLNIAETLVHKNLATYTGKRANPPVRQSKQA